jgi:hypothetical protein
VKRLAQCHVRHSLTYEIWKRRTMRELLIRYLLGELEPEEHDAVQRELAASPELRAELAELRECFAASLKSEETGAEPPRGLAQRVTERVTNSDEMIASPYGISTAAADPPAGVLGWSLADLTVAGGVALAVCMLIFPALRESRDGTRRTICQDNQRQLWFIVADYADTHCGFYPRVEPNENAAIFAVKLVEENVISAKDISALLVCPGAPLAHKIRMKEYKIKIPTLAELRAMSPAKYEEAKKHISPMIAYRFGYFEVPQYYYIRNEPRIHSALFADAPGNVDEGEISPNHGGKVTQVMNADGSVRVLTSCNLPGLNDDLFRNALGRVAAGLGRGDAVLGNGDASPGTLPAAIGQ